MFKKVLSCLVALALVMFYPGIYDQQSLSLFGRLSAQNYYRAFRLVP